MQYKSVFGLLCCELLEEFKSSMHSRNPYQCIQRSQYRLAEESAKRIPNSWWTVNTDNESTFIIAVIDFELNYPKRVLIRGHRKEGKEPLDAWLDDSFGMANPQTCNSIVECLEGWVRWDNLTEPTKANSNEPTSPLLDSGKAGDDEGNGPLLVSKADLDKLLVSITAQSLMKAKDAINWPKAGYAPNGKAHYWDYSEVREAIMNSKLDNKKKIVILSELPEKTSKARRRLRK